MRFPSFQLGSLKDRTPRAAMHISSSRALSNVGWDFICSQTQSKQETAAMKQLVTILQPWENIMCERSMGSMENDVVRSWGQWSIGDCFLASYIFTLQYSLRRFKLTEVLSRQYPYLSMFLDQLKMDSKFIRTLGTNASDWMIDLSSSAAKQACRALSVGTCMSICLLGRGTFVNHGCDELDWYQYRHVQEN